MDRRQATVLIEKFPWAADRLSRIAYGQYTHEDYLWLCPWKLLEDADPWQREVLSDPISNWQLCASRGSGKTTVTAAAVYKTAVLDGKFVLVLSASGRQVKEFHRQFKKYYFKYPFVRGKVQVTEAEFENGGRIVTVPCNEGTVRTYHGVALLVVDEGAKVPDDVYGAIEPSLVISKGRTMALSTPYGQRGWFYREWIDPSRGWRRQEVPWQRCPRIDAQFIADARRKHGDLWVQQEYECKFLPISGGSPFDLSRMCELVDPLEELEYH